MITLPIIYIKEDSISPLIPKLNDSYEKVENVVNPPQKPVINNALSLGDNIPDRLKSPVINPNKKQPKIFIVNVAKGKGAFHMTRNNRFTKKRQQVPINPPAPAMNINFHILSSFHIMDDWLLER